MEKQRLTLMIFEVDDPTTAVAVVHTDNREFCLRVVREYTRRLPKAATEGDEGLDQVPGNAGQYEA